jgi:hypothetical protein
MGKQEAIEIAAGAQSNKRQELKNPAGRSGRYRRNRPQMLPICLLRHGAGRPSFWVLGRTPPSSWLWLVLPRQLDAAAAVLATGHLGRRWQLLIAALFFIDAVKINGS